MHDFTTIVVAFGTSLSATIAVALLLRIGGGKPNIWNTRAIPVGITVAEVARLRWQLSDVAFALVLGAAVGVAVFCAQFLKV